MAWSQFQALHDLKNEHSNLVLINICLAPVGLTELTEQLACTAGEHAWTE